MPRTHFTNFTLDDGETEIAVEYTITGGCPAHYGSLNYPGHHAEAPEVEIVKAFLATEEDVTLTEAEDARMCQWIAEHHEDDDGPDPDDLRDSQEDH